MTSSRAGMARNRRIAVRCAWIAIACGAVAVICLIVVIAAALHAI